MSNFARKIQKTQINTQRKNAVLFGITGHGTLAQALAVNELQPANGVIKLPPGTSDLLIVGGKVWVNNTVCTDRDRKLKPGDHVAVFPLPNMYLHRDEQGRSALRVRDTGTH
jgi:hypothetical protein